MINGVLGSPRPSPVSMIFQKKFQDSAFKWYSLLRFIITKDTKQKCKGKGHMMWSLKATRHKLLRVCSWWSYAGCNNERGQRIWNFVYQGSPVDAHRPGFLMWVHHTGTFYLPHTDIPDHRKESSVQHTPYCWLKQYRVSKPLLPRNDGTLLKHKFPDSIQGSTL